MSPRMMYNTRLDFDDYAGLPYIGMIIGVCFGLGLVVWTNKTYVKKLRANNNIPVPEWRLPLPMFGGVFFCLGMSYEP